MLSVVLFLRLNWYICPHSSGTYFWIKVKLITVKLKKIVLFISCYFSENKFKRWKSLPAIMFLCQGDISRIYDWKIVDLSLVLVLSTFNKVIVELWKTQTKNLTVNRGTHLDFNTIIMLKKISLALLTKVET